MAKRNKKHITFSWSYLYATLGACATLFLLLNAGFITSRISFILNPPTPPDTGTDNVPHYGADTLAISSLDIEAPLIYIETKSESAYQQALKNGVVHYPGTADVGQVGNAYFFGHSSDLPWNDGDFKTIFARLPNIKISDNIIVTDHLGQEFTYIVTATKVIRPTDQTVLNQNTEGKKILTLQTSYPLGTALRRYIVIAELTEATPVP